MANKTVRTTTSQLNVLFEVTSPPDTCCLPEDDLGHPDRQTGPMWVAESNIDEDDNDCDPDTVVCYPPSPSSCQFSRHGID